MEIRFELGDPAAARCDAVIVPVAAGDDGAVWEGPAGALDAALSGQLQTYAADARFTGGRGKTFVMPTLGHAAAKRIVLVGLGSQDGTTEETVTRAYGAGLRAARDAGADDVVGALQQEGDGGDLAAMLEAAAVGAELGAYRFEAYRGTASPDAGRHEVASFRFVGEDISEANAARAIDRARAISRGVALARDLANEPGAVLTPAAFADRAAEVAESERLTIEVLGPAELAAIGAEATLAVGGGSAHPPRMIRLRYEPDGGFSDSSFVPGLVGKAITFDTGGYSIKPYEGMLEMKGDMAGGAAVLGTMCALRGLACPHPVLATICAAENMISDTAFRPGDVLKGMNGVTMEILSTDAEGRLVLADGLVDTARRGATELIDLATLTGAAVVALGDGTTALFASDDDLAAGVLAAAAASGERMWRMPLIEELEKKIEGDVADIKNSGGRAGGAITAALFLRHFREGLPWAHLDIAGSSRQDKPGPLGPKGATGVGVRTLLRYLTAAREGS